MRSYSAESDDAYTRIRDILEEEEGIDAPAWLVLRIENGVRRFRRMGSDTEPSFAERFTTETVQAAYEEDRLLEKYRVIESFRNERERLRTVEWSGLTAIDVINHIPMNESISTRTIAEEIGSATLPTVAKMGNYLAGEIDIKGESQSKHPIVSLQRENTDVYDERWEFTTYGRGLKPYMQLPKTVLQSPFDDIFSYDAIEAVSDGLTEEKQ